MEKGRLDLILKRKDFALIYKRILNLKNEINKGFIDLSELVSLVWKEIYPDKTYRYAYKNIRRLADKYPEINELVKKAKENRKLKRKRMLENAKQTAKEIILGVLNDKQSKGLTLTELYNLLKEKGYKLTWKEFKQIIEEIERELFGEESSREKELQREEEKRELPKVEKGEKPSKGTERKQETPKKGYSLAIPDDFDWDSYAKTLAETNPEEWDLKPLLSLHPPKRRYRFLYYAVVPRVGKKNFPVFFRGIGKIFKKIGLEPVEYTDLIKMADAWIHRREKAELLDFDENEPIVQKYKQDF